jgi:hypothetical protein
MAKRRITFTNVVEVDDDTREWTCLGSMRTDGEGITATENGYAHGLVLDTLSQSLLAQADSEEATGKGDRDRFMRGVRAALANSPGLESCRIETRVA